MNWSVSSSSGIMCFYRNTNTDSDLIDIHHLIDKMKWEIERIRVAAGNRELRIVHFTVPER